MVWKISLILGVQLLNVLGERNFYKILGLRRNASKKDITKAYRKKSLAEHPDKHPDNKEKQTKKFQDISDAYNVLKDSKKRKLYDQYGEKGVDESQQGGGGHGFHHADPFDMFSQFFGGGGGFGGGRAHYSTHGHGHGHGGQQPVMVFAKSEHVKEIKKWNSVEDRVEPYVILFYVNDDAISAAKREMEKLGEKMGNIFKVAGVHCQKFSAICSQEDVEEYPTLKYYSEDQNQDAVAHTGRLKYTDMVNFLSKHMADFTTPVSTMDGLKSWLVSDEHLGARIVLFTEKKKVPLFVKALSREFRKRVAIAVWTQAGNHAKAKSLAGKTLPSVLYVSNLDAVEGEYFKGEMTKFALAKFFREAIKQNRSGPRYGVQGGTYKELTAKSLASGECGPKERAICFLLIGDGEISEDHARLAEKYKNDPLKFVWVRDHPRVRQAFGADGPALVAFRPKRGKFNLYTGGHTFSELDGFVESIVTGAASLSDSLKTDFSLSHDEL